MITVRIPLDKDQSGPLVDTKHTNTLRIHGVPMKSNSLVGGVENGVLMHFDEDNVRTYTWCLTEEVKSKKRFIDRFKKRFRIRRFETLGETWYEVQEKRWYWPVWDSWTLNVVNRGSETIKYPSLYIAERAVSFYVRGEEPQNSIVSQL